VLEKIVLDRRTSKSEYRRVKPYLRRRLYDLEKACWDARVPSVIVFEGWDAAGKGGAIRTLTSRLDPRGFRLYPIHAPRSLEAQLPWLWRFWNRLPNYGEMAIFDHSWYHRVLVERVEGLVPEKAWRGAYQDIVDFERTISDDGYVLVKLFMHISRDEQARRFRKLEADPLLSWHVQPADWERHRRYDEYRLAVEEMLERTETEWGPWTIVEATNRRWARVKVYKTIIQRLEYELLDRGCELPATVVPATRAGDSSRKTRLAPASPGAGGAPSDPAATSRSTDAPVGDGASPNVVHGVRADGGAG